MTIILIFAIIFILLFIYFKYFKVYKIGNVVLITGEVKTGKSALSVKCALQKYRSTLLLYRIKKYIFHKRNIEKPILVSNIPLKVNYTPFTKDILLRNVRLPYRSVCLIDEASLLADSMLYKNDDINEKLMLFIKLWGHYTRNGVLIINTQAIGDLHFALKRCIGRVLYIHSKKRLPFISIFKVRELKYSDDLGLQTNNTINTDLENDLKCILIFNRVFKKYSSTCYSIFTDYLEVYHKNINGKKLKDLRTKNLISLREYKSLKESDSN